MKDFIYYTPTKVYFGKEQIEHIGNILSEYGVKKVLLHYGKSSIKQNGLYDRIVNLFNMNNISYVDFGGVEPNPKLSLVYQGINVARSASVDFILAIGGGSVIDSAKAIAAGYYYDGDVWDFNAKLAQPKKVLPIGVILTIAAAGSEMSDSCVITNEQLAIKAGFNHELNRVKFTIMDPTLTFTVNKWNTACGIVDIMMHTLERIISSPEQKNVLTDRISYSIIKSVIEAGKEVIDDPFNYEARATLMWASSLSHNGLTGCGRDYVFSVHQIEHAVTALFDNVSHGAGLAILWPAWAKEVIKVNSSPIANLGRNVFELSGTDNEVAIKTIEQFKQLFMDISMPVSLQEVNIFEKDIDNIALKYSQNKNRVINDIIKIDYEMCKKILYNCLEKAK